LDIFFLMILYDNNQSVFLDSVYELSVVDSIKVDMNSQFLIAKFMLSNIILLPLRFGWSLLLFRWALGSILE